MDLVVDLNYFQTCRDYLNRCENIIVSVRNTVLAQRSAMSERVLRSSGASSQIREVCERLQKNKESVSKMRNALGDICDEYRSMENSCKELSRGVNIGAATATNGAGAGWSNTSSSSGVPSDNKGISDDTWDLIWSLIECGGPFGATMSLIGSLITGGVSFATGKSAAKIVEGVADICTDSSFDWKKIFGFDEWQPEKWDDYLFGKGKGVAHNTKAFAKWAGHILTGIINIHDNFSGDREGENNSNGRAFAESLGETAVDIFYDWGAPLLIGLATGAPVILVAAGAVVAKWALDGVCEWAFGKDFTETVSDAVLDTIEAAGEAIGEAVENTVEAVGDAVRTIGEKVSGWWNRVFA